MEKALLIVWHSRTGGAEQMAKAAAEAARATGDVQVRLLEADKAGPDDLTTADGYVFACPENLAAMSGEMKAFFDRCYYPVLETLNGRPYAVLVCAGSDGANAVRQITRIATGWRLKQVAEPIIVNTAAQTPEKILAQKQLTQDELAPCVELGAAMATGLALGVF